MRYVFDFNGYGWVSTPMDDCRDGYGLGWGNSYGRGFHECDGEGFGWGYGDEQG